MKIGFDALNRRTVLAGMAALATVRPAAAADSDSPLAHGALANKRGAGAGV